MAKIAMERLAGRKALITGGARGIGAAVARRYVAEGAAVAIAHEPTEAMTELAAKLASELTADGGTAVTVSADLARVDGPATAVDEARSQLGPLDILVANAAASGRGAWHGFDVDTWDHVQSVNVRGTWLLAKAAYPDLRKSGRGAIITVTSVMMMTGQADALHYTTSKAAILGMTRALARESGPDNIRVNSVMPGAIRTENEVEMTPDAESVKAWALERQSLQRRGFAEDLAGTFAFLASDDAAFITGQVICVDGGWVMY